MRFISRSMMSRGIAYVASAFAWALFAAAPATAGVGGAAGPTWPATLNVGSPVSAYIDIVNASDGGNASENVDILLITFTPSCAGQTVGQCTTPDLGVFTLSPIAIGDPTSSCKNTIFTFIGPSASGVYTLSPSGAVHLGPADGSGGVNNPKQCRIVINATVAKLPIDSTPPNPPATTFQFARAVLRGQTSQAVGAASGQATIAISSVANMVIAKTDGVSAVEANGSTTYTVTVTNSGPSAANGAIVKDPVAAGLSKTAAACIGTTGGAVCPASTTPALLEGAGVVIPTFPANSTVTFTVTADVTATSGTVKNTASITPPTGTTNPGTSCTTLPDPNSRTFGGGVCTAGDLDNVTPVADLVISKTDGVSSVNAGGSTTYTVVVTNPGPSAADGAIVTDPVAAGLSKTAAACVATTGGAVCPGTVNPGLLEGAGVVIPTFPANSTVTFTVTANVTATSGSVKNTASVAPPAGTTNPGTSCSTLPDPNSRSFAANVCTAGDLDTVSPIANMVISKTNGVLSVNAGTSTTYTVVVSNPGPSSADGAVVTDPAVAGLSKTAAACIGASGGAACPASTTVALLEGAGVVIPTFPAGATVTFTVTATVTAGSGTVKNSASVAPPAGTTNLGTNCTTLPDPNSRNFSGGVCTAGDQDSVAAVSDLFISKSSSAADYIPGDTFTYTIVVANNGPSPAINAAVADTKPTQISTWTWVCADATGGATGCTAQAASANNFSDNVDLPANSTITYTVTATAAGNATGDIVNKATVTPPVGTTNPGTSCVTGGGITRSFNDPTTGACSSTVTMPQGLGVGGGHFDFDIYYFDTGKYKNKKHIHQWDNKWNVTGVNVDDPSDTNFRLALPIPLTTTQFKVLVANQFLNPAAFLAFGTGSAQQSVKTFGGLAGPSTDAATVLAGLPIYTRPTAYNPDGLSNRFIINLPKTAFNSIDWWGDGDPARAGVIPNQTGCVNGVNDDGSTDDVGPNGERFNGALVVTFIKHDTPDSAIELNVPGEPKYGWRVKVTAAPNPFAQYVLAEYTMFWHHPNGKCYNGAGWVPNPPLEVETGAPVARPTGTADPTGPLPPNPTIAP